MSGDGRKRLRRLGGKAKYEGHTLEEQEVRLGVQSLSQWAPVRPEKEVQPHSWDRVYCHPS